MLAMELGTLSLHRINSRNVSSILAIMTICIYLNCHSNETLYKDGIMTRMADILNHRFNVDQVNVTNGENMVKSMEIIRVTPTFS